MGGSAQCKRTDVMAAEQTQSKVGQSKCPAHGHEPARMGPAQCDECLNKTVLF